MVSALLRGILQVAERRRERLICRNIPSEHNLPAQALLSALHAAKPAHVIDLSLFDVYRGRGLTDGRKSLAILVLMQDTARTLTDAEIDATVADIVSLLGRRFGATLRT